MGPLEVLGLLFGGYWTIRVLLYLSRVSTFYYSILFPFINEIKQESPLKYIDVCNRSRDIEEG